MWGSCEVLSLETCLRLIPSSIGMIRYWCVTMLPFVESMLIVELSFSKAVLSSHLKNRFNDCFPVVFLVDVHLSRWLVTFFVLLCFFLTIQYEIFVTCMRIVKIWFRFSLFSIQMFLFSACKVKFSLMYSLSAQSDILTIMKVIVSTFNRGLVPLGPSTHSLEFQNLRLLIGQQRLWSLKARASCTCISVLKHAASLYSLLVKKDWNFIR